MYSHYYTPCPKRGTLPQRRTRVETFDGEERTKLAHVAAYPFAPPTELDKEASEGEHEQHVNRTSQEEVACHQDCDEPEHDAGR